MMRYGGVLPFALLFIAVQSGSNTIGQDSDKSAAPPAEKQDPQEKVNVKQFKLNGATLCDPADLREVLAPHEGKDLTLQEIKAVADAVTALYHEQGYILAVAFVPKQEIKDGIVEITVLEGHLEKIKVSDTMFYDSDFIGQYLSPLTATSGVRMDDINRSLLLLNDLPQMSARGTMRPGTETGGTIMNIDVEEKFPVWGGLNYDNYGTEAISKHRLGASLGIANLWDIGHWITFQAVTGLPVKNLSYYRASYHAPIGTDGLVLATAYARSDYEVDGVLRILDPQGQGDMIDFWASYPVIKRRNLTLNVEAGFEWKDFQNEILGIEFSRDKLSVFRVGAGIDYLDPIEGRNIASLQLRQGVADFLGSLDSVDTSASRLGSGGKFTKLLFSYRRNQRILDWLSIVARFKAQWADNSHPLVVSEMMGIGGYNSVRGYPSYEFTGDRGIEFGGELHVTPPWLLDVEDPFDADSGYTMAEMIRFVGFYDHAVARRFRPALGEDDLIQLRGWGGGIRLGYPGLFNIAFDVGFPFKDDVNPSTGREPTFYTGIEMSFSF